MIDSNGGSGGRRESYSEQPAIVRICHVPAKKKKANALVNESVGLFQQHDLKSN
jgi:hypothetical protein